MSQRVLILGSDGYIGWPLSLKLANSGYEVYGTDNLSGREYRGRSVVPIEPPSRRVEAVDEINRVGFIDTVFEYDRFKSFIEDTNPETIVNLAQIPSAPYSMANRKNSWEVQRNNILGSLNLFWALREIGIFPHVIQLATMGEYPEGADIPEGFLDDGRPAPKSGGSLYHTSKINTTANTLFLAQTWGIPTSEVYQGIVYGLNTEDTFLTRFDVDEQFGTLLNRFTAQAAIGHPLTVYGRGGQTRAMLSLSDSLQCLQLLIENPPDEAYRAVNQFDGSYSVNEIAEMVSDKTGVEISHIENPRVENENHEYDPERKVLDRLGYSPTRSIENEFDRTYKAILPFKDRIRKEKILPEIEWN